MGWIWAIYSLAMGWISGWPSAIYWLAKCWQLPGYRLLSAGYWLTINWLWAGYGLAMGGLSAIYGLTLGWIWAGYWLTSFWYNDNCKYWIVIYQDHSICWKHQASHSNPCLQWASIPLSCVSRVKGQYVCLLLCLSSLSYSMGTFFRKRHFCVCIWDTRQYRNFETVGINPTW